MKKTLSAHPPPHAGRVLIVIPVILVKGPLGMQTVCGGPGTEGIGCKHHSSTL